VLGRIKCPILFLVGAEDWAPLAVSQGIRCLEECGSAVKRLRVVERAEGWAASPTATRTICT
jgi:hypothetical protein